MHTGGDNSPHCKFGSHQAPGAFFQYGIYVWPKLLLESFLPAGRRPVAFAKYSSLIRFGMAAPCRYIGTEVPKSGSLGSDCVVRRKSQENKKIGIVLYHLGRRRGEVVVRQIVTKQ